MPRRGAAGGEPEFLVSSWSATTPEEKNTSHYEAKYMALQVDDLVRKAGDFRFFDKAVRCYTSWRTLYRGDFRDRLKGKTVLELGFGSGLNALLMARFGARIIAVETARPAVEALKAASARLRLDVEAVHGDFRKLPLPRVDIVVGKAFLHHLTHEQEAEFLEKIAMLLRPDGEARFVEPAVNSKLLDALRWVTPVPGRPSVLQRRKFARWKEADPHPPRDNSSAHYFNVGMKFFQRVRICPVGAFDRFRRLAPSRRLELLFVACSLALEQLLLPDWLHRPFASGQLIEYSAPRQGSAAARAG